MIGYPITPSPNGGITISDDPERDKILALLKCRFWERCLVPGFGVPDFLFEPIGSADVGQIVLAYQIALDYWIGDDITVESIPIDPEEGVIQLQISYGNGSGVIQWAVDLEQLKASNIQSPQ